MKIPRELNVPFQTTSSGRAYPFNAPKKELIEGWLKAGFSLFQSRFPKDKANKYLTETGTPQGGVISPLLTNIGLHGLETKIRNHNPKHGIIRSADDWRPRESLPLAP